MDLPLASSEQLSIVKSLLTSNTIVDSVAGSGKTTTALHIALTHTNKKILLLTYNASLKIDTRQKVCALNLKNLEVHNYHAFCCKYMDRSCINDECISRVMNTQRLTNNYEYDIIIVDEAQDMTHLYFQIVCHIVGKNKNECKLCIIGDKDQSIYAFNNADQRYITMADKVFSFNSVNWTRLRLSTSYRVTHQMALFINNCVLNEDRMISDKQGDKVKYIVCNVFDDTKTNHRYEDYVPLKELMKYLQRYKYEDIFVIAPSVKSPTSPARVLANRLTKQNIPIFVPNTDDEKMDEEVMRGKIVFSTFHQVKGCQRKVVLVFGFDDFYVKLYAKDVLPNRCPNPLYVAVSRAQEQLVVFHHYSNGYLPFLNMRALSTITEFVSYEKVKLSRTIKHMSVIDTNVTELTKFLPVSVVEQAKSILDFEVVQSKDDFIDIPRKSMQGKFVENVSEITGTAIPAYLDYLYTGNSVILSSQSTLFEDNDEDINDPPTLLRFSNIYCSKTSKYTYKLSQIKEYNWLTSQNLSNCVKRLQCHITKDAVFEKQYIIENPKVQYNRKLIGIVDCIHQGDEVWELKCVSKLISEHLIQLALYAYMIETDERRKQKVQIVRNEEKNIMELLGMFNITPTEEVNELHKKYFLFNILDNKIIQLKTSYKDLCDMTKFLIQKRYVSNLTMSDQDFVKECDATKNKCLSS